MARIVPNPGFDCGSHSKGHHHLAHRLLRNQGLGPSLADQMGHKLRGSRRGVTWHNAEATRLGLENL